jgi:hypothetical protein
VTGVVAPLALATDADGDLFVLDGNDGHAVELLPGPSGTLSDGVQTTLVSGGANAIATDTGGDLYVASDGALKELLPGGDGKLAGGTELSLPRIAAEPEGLAVDQSGDVFASDIANPDVFELAHGAGAATGLGFAGLDLPFGVAVDDATGDVYVANSSNSEVDELSFGPGGGQSPLPSTVPQPDQLAFDGHDLLVSDLGGRPPERITPGLDGKLTDGTVSAVPFTGLVNARGVAADASGDLFASAIGLDDKTPQVVELIKNVGAVSAAQSTITAAPATAPADGVSSVTVTVQARDAHGNPVPTGGDTVAMHAGSGTLSRVTDHGDGTYTATLTSTEKGLVSVFASLNGNPIADDVTVGFTSPPVVGPPSAAHSTITAAPATAVADGTSSATIAVQARDAADTPETTGGDSVVLSTTRGTLSAVRDRGDGTYTATLTSTQAGAAVVTATLGGAAVTGSATVTFSPVAPGAGTPPLATPPLGPPPSGPTAPMPTAKRSRVAVVTRISKITISPHSIGICHACAHPTAKVSFTLSRAAQVRVLVQARRHGHWTTIHTVAIKAHAGTTHHTLTGHWAGALKPGAQLRLVVQLHHGHGWITHKTVTLKARRVPPHRSAHRGPDSLR